jgi:glutathione S-transferase
MPLKLYYHPLSSFCHKALIALYENAIPFDPIFVDLGDEASSAPLRALWPMAKFPVLRDEAAGATVAEATVIIEYLDTHYRGATRFIPEDVDLAWQTRMWDRFYDLYAHVQMQKIVGDRLRPAGATDASGVEQAKATIRQAYAMIEQKMDGKIWAIGDDYSLVDCAASPALFYANTVLPFDPEQRNLRGYFERLMARPSYARALREAQPYFDLFPMDVKLEIPGRGDDNATHAKASDE